LSVYDQQARETVALVHFLIPFREWYDDLVST
jgi:hypothetical protein